MFYRGVLFILLFGLVITQAEAQLICKTSNVPNNAGICQQELYNPVCGCDTVTYRHPCDATQINNVQFFTEGVCPTQPFFVDLYPVPTSPLVPIKLAVETLPNIELAFSIFIYDVYGVLHRQILVPNTSRFDWTIRSNTLRAGVYLALVIESNSGFAVTKKFIISSF